MTEAEFEAMLARASQKKAEQQERFQATSQRRQTLLAKAIQTHRVVPNFTEVSAEPSSADLRHRFDNEMNRLIRQHAGPSTAAGNAGDAADDSGSYSSEETSEG